MVEIQFKQISRNKYGLHVLKYLAEEQKGDAVIKSTICITMEDTEILPIDTFDVIVEKGQKIARREYEKK